MSDSSRRLPVEVGQLLAGKYRVEAVLGEGGMGVVVAATHVQLEKRVAIKFMLPAALEDRQAVERFLREARSAVQLTSEHVARVLDVGTLESGAPYIVMELLEGRTLEELVLERGPLPVGDAVEYVVQVCEAVAEAHGRNIVHRDLKLANLFLTQRVDKGALVKVLDFGLSKVIGPNAKARLTRDLAIMGTPEYMSPEQLRSSADVDTRADLWSLGVILFELLTGQTPFQAPSMPEVCALVLHEPPRSLLELAPDVPEALVAVIERCLEKEPDRRFQDVASFAEALEPFVPRGTVRPGDRIRRVQFETVAPPRWSKKLVDDSSPTLVANEPKRATGISWGVEAPSSLGRAARLGGAVGALVLFVLAGTGVYLTRRSAGEPGDARRPAVAASVPAMLPSEQPPPVAGEAPPPPSPAPAPSTTPLPSAVVSATRATAASPARSNPSPATLAAPAKPARSKAARDKLLESR